jgi:putative hydrolase of the HAD superfamily
MSKPNLGLFNLMVQKVKACNKSKQISLADIIHIGDNPAADIAGANDAGLQSLLINSNNLSILSLLSS